VAYQFQHRTQSLMGNDFALMGVGQFVELPKAQFSTFVFDLYAAVWVVNHRNSLAGEPLVLSDGIHQLQNFVVL
jgi:hypothetical protein